MNNNESFIQPDLTLDDLLALTDDDAFDLRMMIIDHRSFDTNATLFAANEIADTMHHDDMLDAIHSLDRESLTTLALHHSLCPLHLIDYAICFDDADPECAAIRTIHPTHDT